MARVAQEVIDREVAEVANLIAEHAAGISRAALQAEYRRRHGRRMSTRTMLRRIEILIDRGLVEGEGDTNLRVYRPVASAETPAPNTPTAPAVPSEAAAIEVGSLPISREGLAVFSQVQRPIMEREPVTYDRTVLERYTPGLTWYLDPALRERLHAIGRTPDPDRPAGTYAREIVEQLLVDLAWASSRLEGNTYSRLDTKNLLEFGQRAEGKDATEAQMILNHKGAIELLVEQAGRLAFDRQTLLTLHSLLSENLLGDPADEGRLRGRIVQITGTVYTPIAIPQVIEECFDLFLTKARAIPDPFEQAFFAMVHIPYLQPFVDVNKRTSRLAANIPLIAQNLCPLSFVDVPERIYVEATLGVYEQRRIEPLRDLFAWAYERSSKQYKVVREAMGQPDALRLRYRDELREIVHETVVAGAPPRLESMCAWAIQHAIPAADQDGFAERALELLLSLHEGSAARYGLRQDDFFGWKRRFSND